MDRQNKYRQVNYSSPRNPQKPGASIAITLLNIALVIFLLILIIAGANLIKEVRSSREGYYNENSALYRIEEESFGSLGSDFILNGRAVEDDHDEAEYVAQYVNAAFLYKANEEAGDTEQAAAGKAAMDEARSHLKIYTAAADQVDVKLGIK